MFIVLLRFSDNKALAPQYMEGHKRWLQQGFDDGVFLVSGGLRPDGGGAILAHGVTLPALRQRVRDDPFVAQGVVDADIVEVAASKADERLAFLLS